MVAADIDANTFRRSIDPEAAVLSGILLTGLSSFTTFESFISLPCVLGVSCAFNEKEEGIVFDDRTPFDTNPCTTRKPSKMPRTNISRITEIWHRTPVCLLDSQRREHTTPIVMVVLCSAQTLKMRNVKVRNDDVVKSSTEAHMSFRTVL